jgi:VanZ family protein
MENDKKSFIRWLLFIAWGAVILWLSLTPAPLVIKTSFLGWDKFLHAVSYGIFTILAERVFSRFSAGKKKKWVKAVIAAVIFGGLMEIAQMTLTETRTAEWGDLLADAFGAGFVYSAFMAAHIVLSPSPPPSE